MRFSSNFKMLPVAAMLVTAFGASSHAATSSWMPTQSHAVDVSGAIAREAMQSGEAMHVVITLQARNKAALDTIAADIISGKSSRTLSSEEMKGQFSPTQDQVDAVVNHLKKSGFVNIEVASNNLLITADGTAGTARTAFNVEMQHFEKNGQRYYANVTDPVVPAELANIVLSVHGLQNLHRAHPMMVKSNEVTVDHASSVDASKGSETPHLPTAWPTIYNTNSIPNAVNANIGIITAGSLTQTIADLKTFAKSAALPIPATSIVNIGGNGTSDSSGATEWDIDSQDSLGAAGGVVKSMIFYNAPTLSDADLTAMFNRVVSDNQAKVINISLGGCETEAKADGSEASDDQIFEAAVAQGQTFAVSSGASGSGECQGATTTTQSYPAVSPYVIAVGGTTLYTTAAGAWASEVAWSGSGGGPSTTETAPTWQRASGVLGASTKRGVPDVAFDGDPSSGVEITVRGQTQTLGGTSLSVPIFTGFWARIQSAHANGLAFPASALYKYGVANEATLFHDITSGSNGSYSAKKGWDYTSGFGSINVGSLANFINSHSGF